MQLGFTPGDETGKADQKAEKDAQYANSLGMLTYLGLQQYHNNVKKGLLTDDTIMLWTENALADVKIPPGPRCALAFRTPKRRCCLADHLASHCIILPVIAHLLHRIVR